MQVKLPKFVLKVLSTKIVCYKNKDYYGYLFDCKLFKGKDPFFHISPYYVTDLFLPCTSGQDMYQLQQPTCFYPV